MLEGRQHKKEAAVVEAASALRLRGALFYGRPGILVAEGPQAEHDELVREARKAGKKLKPKKTQKLAGGAAEAHYTNFTTISGDGLDVDTLKGLLGQLDLEHKYRFILGLEEIARPEA